MSWWNVVMTYSLSTHNWNWLTIDHFVLGHDCLPMHVFPCRSLYRYLSVGDFEYSMWSLTFSSFLGSPLAVARQQCVRACPYSPSLQAQTDGWQTSASESPRGSSLRPLSLITCSVTLLRGGCPFGGSDRGGGGQGATDCVESRGLLTQLRPAGCGGICDRIPHASFKEVWKAMGHSCDLSHELIRVQPRQSYQNHINIENVDPPQCMNGFHSTYHIPSWNCIMSLHRSGNWFCEVVKDTCVVECHPLSAGSSLL